MLELLQARGVPVASAVAFGAMICPVPVAMRVVEMAGNGRYHRLCTLTTAMSLGVLAIVMLALGLPLVAMAVIRCRAGNGIYSIVRGTVPWR